MEAINEIDTSCSLLSELVDLLTSHDLNPTGDEMTKKLLFEQHTRLQKMAKDFEIDYVALQKLSDDNEKLIEEAENPEMLEGPVEADFLALRSKKNATKARNYGALGVLKKCIQEGVVVRCTGDDDDDVVEAETVVRQKDPISGGEITEPVRNKYCHHVYHKPSIEAHVARNKSERRLCQCPQPGCSNKRSLLLTDCEPFPEFLEGFHIGR